MIVNGALLISVFLLVFIPQSPCLKVLFVTVGAAGHMTPVFELAKAMTMKSHNVTFLTDHMSRSYIDFTPYKSPSFQVVYGNDSSDAFRAEKAREQGMMSLFTDRSVLDVAPDLLPIFGAMIVPLLNKSMHLLTSDHFDVIVAGKMVLGITALCEKASIPCVIQVCAPVPNVFDFNLPNTFSFLTPDDMTETTTRLYQVAFTFRLLAKLLPKVAPVAYRVLQSLPQIPGSFLNTFTLKNLFFSKQTPLNLFSVPPSFGTPAYPHHYTKYLGAFIDDSVEADGDTELTRWITAKPTSSIVYGAFGSSSLIPRDRMKALITGLAMFALQQDDCFVLLALRSANYDTYLAVMNDLTDERVRSVLQDGQRVRIEQGFVPQKWILKQNSIKVFISHCGMGSLLESLHFSRPILCLPFNMEQFANAIIIAYTNVGRSLFEPPSRWKSLVSPYDVVHYRFAADNVVDHMSALWLNPTYTNAAVLMALEMKHAGGVQRAVEEIEHFVSLNGNLDRYAPFQSTLPFYQRYMLDLLLVFVLLPGWAFVYLARKCCKRQRKLKSD